MPPRDSAQDDDLAAHARSGAPAPDPKSDSPGLDDAALPAPAEPDVSARASGAHDVTNGGPNNGHPMITRGSLRNEPSRTAAAPNFGDHGENGRIPGRSSISWARPRMVEKLLLHMHYELVRHGRAIPFDCIANRLHPGSRGMAVEHFLSRTRERLVAEGHLVPPPVTFFEHDVRGFARSDPESDDVTSTRPVRFDEPYDDALSNLADAERSRPGPRRKRQGTQARGEAYDAAPVVDDDEDIKVESKHRIKQEAKRPRIKRERHESQMAPAAVHNQQAPHENAPLFKRPEQPPHFPQAILPGSYGAPTQQLYAPPDYPPPHHNPPTYLGLAQGPYGDPPPSYHYSPGPGYGAPFGGHANPAHDASYHGYGNNAQVHHPHHPHHHHHHRAPSFAEPRYGNPQAHHPHQNHHGNPHRRIPPLTDPSPRDYGYRHHHQQPGYYYHPAPQRGPHPSYEHDHHTHQAGPGYTEHGAPGMAAIEYGAPNMPPREYGPPDMAAREQHSAPAMTAREYGAPNMADRKEEYGVPNPNSGYDNGATAAADAAAPPPPPPPPQRRSRSVDSSVVPRVGTAGLVRDQGLGVACDLHHEAGRRCAGYYYCEGLTDEEEVEEEQVVEEGLSVKE